MLTITEIKEKKFEKSAFGYKVDEVENFLNDIIDLVSALEKENAENQKKLMVLAGKIEEYREEEDSLRQALLGAQKLGDSILKEAKNRAELIMRDATIKSENIVKNVKEDVKREEIILNKMKREVDSFRTKMLTMYNTHIDMIKSIPEAPVEIKETEPVKEAEVVESIVEEPVEAPVIVNEAEPNEIKEAVEVEEEIVEEVVTPPTTAAEETEKKEENFFSGGFKFSRFDEKDNKIESKFGPLKFGDEYDINED